MNTTSRRALLAGAPAAAAAALAGGTITTALAMASPKAEGLDWLAIVRRAEEVTDRLQKYYGPDWTSGDQEAAAGVLAYCRGRGAGLPDDETAWKATLSFFWDYGQSLDYVIYGDPASMIAKSAARSPRGRPAWEADIDPIFALIEAYDQSASQELALYRESSRLEIALPKKQRTWSVHFGGDGEGRWPPEGCTAAPEWLKVQLAIGEVSDRISNLKLALLTTPPTTIEGVVALLERLDAAGFREEQDLNDADSLIATMGNWYDDRVEEAAAEFHSTLAVTLRDIVAGQA
jgi:hypothetical protein